MSFKNIPEQVSYFVKLDSYKPEDIFYHNMCFLPVAENNEIREVAKMTLFDRVKPYYAKRGLEATNYVYNFLVEPLKNANFHGGCRNSFIKFELLLTPLVLLSSFNDGGDYFKRLEVKEAWENRIQFSERHEVSDDVRSQGIGFGAGTGMIYDLSDFINVDISNGTLYTGVTAKKFCQ